MSEFGESYLPEGAENFVAPSTSEAPTKEEVIESALKRAAEATPESVLRSPTELEGDFKSNVEMWEKEVKISEEMLARPDLSEKARKNWEAELRANQKNLEHYRQGYEKFKQRHGLS